MPDTSVFMSRRLWFGITRWTWLRLAYAFVVLMGSLGLYAVQRNGEEDRQRQAQSQIDENYQSCLRGNDFRDVLRSVVVEATKTNAIDLTVVPGFEKLDPNTQQFLSNIKIATVSPPSDDPNSFKNRALALLVNRNCEVEFPNHS